MEESKEYSTHGYPTQDILWELHLVTNQTHSRSLPNIHNTVEKHDYSKNLQLKISNYKKTSSERILLKRLLLISLSFLTG